VSAREHSPFFSLLSSGYRAIGFFGSFSSRIAVL